MDLACFATLELTEEAEMEMKMFTSSVNLNEKSEIRTVKSDKTSLLQTCTKKFGFRLICQNWSLTPNLASSKMLNIYLETIYESRELIKSDYNMPCMEFVHESIRYDDFP